MNSPTHQLPAAAFRKLPCSVCFRMTDHTAPTTAPEKMPSSESE